jgi:hypothetical protein
MNDYEPYQTTVDPFDSEYEVGTLTEVTANTDGTGWSVLWRGDDEPEDVRGSTGCGVPKLRDDQPTPAVGGRIRIYGSFGRPIRGIAIDGACVFYRTEPMQAEHHRRWVERYHREQHERFERERAQLDADFETLPPLFQHRIARFRAADPDFRWKSEAYEMFCVTQATLLASHFRAQTGDPLQAIEAIKQWDKINSAEHDPPYDYQAQEAAVPGWSDGHSGNTHGAAMALAAVYLRHLAGEQVAV